MNTATLVAMLKDAVDTWHANNDTYIEGPKDSYLMEELREAMERTVLVWSKMRAAG